MLFLKKNTINEVYLTLREKSSIVYAPLTATTSYLFSFVNYQTKAVLNFIPVQLSSTTRYDLFQITETGNTYVSLTGGTVNLAPNYFYTYTIYENQTATPYNLDISLTTGNIIEQGKVLVSGNTSEVLYTVYSGNSNTTNIVYTG